MASTRMPSSTREVMAAMADRTVQHSWMPRVGIGPEAEEQVVVDPGGVEARLLGGQRRHAGRLPSGAPRRCRPAGPMGITTPTFIASPPALTYASGARAVHATASLRPIMDRSLPLHGLRIAGLLARPGRPVRHHAAGRSRRRRRQARAAGRRREPRLGATVVGRAGGPAQRLLRLGQPQQAQHRGRPADRCRPRPARPPGRWRRPADPQRPSVQRRAAGARRRAAARRPSGTRGGGGRRLLAAAIASCPPTTCWRRP